MDSNHLIKLAAKAADNLKAVNIQMIQIEMVSSIADWIMISEGLSDVQVRSIVRSIEDELDSKANILPLRKEGVNEGKWALLDYGDIIINVFQPRERKYYELESFWSNGIIYNYLDTINEE
ncbi:MULTISPECIES: ribosome silencing factor [unclassified Prochlorococcus]|uniref:ribosome silencing factor n=1 Tax=unclassified Prochlorococcus TaxID=2627481 RepID=UPI00053380FA|nr:MULTISPECIES: ribosome silencing factor [unclassified Prochlorococcus]KGG17490.1 Iojap protein [Prochlorococcus sp. MIT 0603]